MQRGNSSDMLSSEIVGQSKEQVWAMRLSTGQRSGKANRDSVGTHTDVKGTMQPAAESTVAGRACSRRKQRREITITIFGTHDMNKNLHRSSPFRVRRYVPERRPKTRRST